MHGGLSLGTNSDQPVQIIAEVIVDTEIPPVKPVRAARSNIVVLCAQRRFTA
jgi:hypothetical protein